MGPLRSPLVEMASRDVDEARGRGGWIVWQIFGRYELTLRRVCFKPFLAVSFKIFSIKSFQKWLVTLLFSC